MCLRSGWRVGNTQLYLVLTLDIVLNISLRRSLSDSAGVRLFAWPATDPVQTLVRFPETLWSPEPGANSKCVARTNSWKSPDVGPPPSPPKKKVSHGSVCCFQDSYMNLLYLVAMFDWSYEYISSEKPKFSFLEKGIYWKQGLVKDSHKLFDTEIQFSRSNGKQVQRLRFLSG